MARFRRVVKQEAKPLVSLRDVVRREVVATPDGKSGSIVERLHLSDGRRLVLKRLVRNGDWLSRSTRDDGRLARLWSEGIFGRIPEVIDHTMVDVQTDGDAWLVFMNDASEALLADEVSLSLEQHTAVVEAMLALHREFWGEHITDLCPLELRFTFLSPITAREESRGDAIVPGLIVRGWELFPDVVPADVSDAVFAILEQPSLLAGPLRARPCTLIHGDLKLGNLGFSGNRIVMMDWGDRTGMAPPSVEFAWYLAINATRISAPNDELVSVFRSASADLHDENALQLALIGALVQLGWNKALNVTDPVDENALARERADLNWWVSNVRSALEEVAIL